MHYCSQEPTHGDSPQDAERTSIAALTEGWAPVLSTRFHGYPSEGKCQALLSPIKGDVLPRRVIALHVMRQLTCTRPPSARCTINFCTLNARRGSSVLMPPATLAPHSSGSQCCLQFPPRHPSSPSLLPTFPSTAIPAACQPPHLALQMCPHHPLSGVQPQNCRRKLCCRVWLLFRPHSLLPSLLCLAPGSAVAPVLQPRADGLCR